MSFRKDWSRLVAEAEALIGEGKASQAYGLLLEAKGRAGGIPGFYSTLAKAALALREVDVAEHWWLQSLQKDSDAADSYVGLGTAQYHLGKLSDSVQSYHRALDLNPESQGAHISLALAYLGADCASHALLHAEKVLALVPDHVDMRLTRAASLIKLDRASDAVDDLAWLHKVGAKPGEVGLLECEVNSALGEYEAALVLAAELVESFPNLPVPLTTFRRTFESFIKSASVERVNAFLDGVGVPRQTIRAAKRRRLAKKTPKIDIVIPVHDGLEDLKACLASIERHRSAALGQIILVNDCSSRKTRAWLRGIARSRKGIQLVHTRKPSGFTRALAHGLLHSRSKRFVALNSDCMVGKDWLERLGAAMVKEERVAMVGPLSNNAGWQSLQQVFDTKGNYSTHPMPSPDEMDRVHDRLQLLSVFDAPDTSLIHGFCVLVDREIYDAIGGLDVAFFPNGYGEFQDLSLRALDAGYALRIADTCFVAHVRGGSISGSRREELSREGRRSLYQRHTALRYLTAESSAVFNPHLTFLRNRFQTLDRYCPGEVRVSRRRARMTVHGDAAAYFAGDRVCVFVSFAPDGRLLPYTKHYLAELKAEGFRTVLVLNEEGQHRLPPEALGLATVVILRDNLGFDFGAWRDAMARLPSVWHADTVLFTNDSIIGPFKGFDKVIERIAVNQAPMFFLTESDFARPHFQSFFWGMKAGGLTNPVIRAFLDSVQDLPDKSSAIFLYEVFLRDVCETLAGLESFCLFPLGELTGVDSDIRRNFNPTHHLWRELLRAGFPFLKADFCRKNAFGPDAAAWHKELEAIGDDLARARLHVEALQVQRMSR